tara:strand:- start:352 stop:654 length:303 start_codon:yes stop_codon:yes gene_type:complete
MASNVKWYKRAIRTLSSGDEKLWNAIKRKLPQERIDLLENKFLGKQKEPQKDPTAEKKQTKTKTAVTPKVATTPGEVKTPRKKSRKKATKTKIKKETQDG